MRISLHCFLLLLICLTSFGNTFPLEVQEDQAHELEIRTGADGALSLRSTGVDPQLVLSVASEGAVDPEATILAFEYFCPDGVDFAEVFYAKEGQTNWGQGRAFEGGALPVAEAWQPFAIDLKLGTKGNWTPEDRSFRIDFGRTSGLELQVRNFHLRPPTEEEQMGSEAIEAKIAAKVESASKLDRYLNTATTPARVDLVAVDATHIRISGIIDPGAAGSEFYLVEYEPHENPWAMEGGTILFEPKLKRNFSVSLPRFVEDRDRMVNRYAVVRMVDGSSQLISHAVWASDVAGAAEREMPRLRPANKKGLAGISLKKGIFEQDISELGITAATVNFPLGAILQSSGNPIEYIHQGKTYTFNGNTMQQFDKKIHWLTANDIVVSAILLVQKNTDSLVHPDYNSAGIYSMADMTHRESTDAYRAVVAFLAERYSRPDRENGWITHWIIFNEVDYGWIWTNMGEQPMARYMDTYNKAMHLTWLEVRRFNPTAEVFISLTHSWEYSPADELRAYPPRAMLDRMALYSARTGDYGWGVAYHPYPQSLLRPRTWEDTKATASFDSHYITPKNIEVLDAYLHQPHFLHQDKVRTVLLSEQGFHTPDYSEESMRDKAAAIAYTWVKILPLESVESYHYHRWVDHPMEGGLKVGLRTLPEPGKPFGDRKEPAFSVFSALETDAQADAIEPFKSVLGIDDWAEVRIPASEIKR